MPAEKHTSDEALLAHAARYLEGLIDLEKVRPSAQRRPRLSLAPIRALLERLGEPQKNLRVLHVAGSKGKGSTALFAESMLRAADRRVGTFTSPHLERWTERFRVDGAEVAPRRLASAVEELRPHVAELRAAAGDTVPSFFDATTAAALVVFRDAGVEYAVLEVGLGGRLDSTNAVAPAVCCITSIELEHTEILGEDLASIAAEKAGILKPGVPAVCGALAPEALEVVERRARELSSPLARLGREIEWSWSPPGEPLGAGALQVREADFALQAALGAAGAHQASNAALAAAAVHRLLPDVGSEVLARGLGEARLPGRVEVVGRAPWRIVDAAHTEASARALASALAPLPGSIDYVLSISSGKDIRAILEILTPRARSLTFTRAEPARSLDPSEIAAVARELRPGVESRVVPNPHLALRAVLENASDEAVLCATGSVYLAGIARRVWGSPTSAPVAVTRSTS